MITCYDEQHTQIHNDLCGIFIGYFSKTHSLQKTKSYINQLSVRKYPQPKDLSSALWNLPSSQAYMHFNAELTDWDKGKLKDEASKLPQSTHELIDSSKTFNELLDKLITSNLLYNRPNHLRSIIVNQYDSKAAAMRAGSFITLSALVGLIIDNAKWLGPKILWAASNGPFLGLIFHTLVLAQEWAYYLACDRHEKQSTCKNTKLASETLRLGLILTGHILNICSIACPWIFILSAIIEGSEALYEYLWTKYTEDKPTDEAAINQHELILNQRFIHLCAAVLLVGCVIAWNLLPPGLIVSLVFVSFLALVLIARACIKEYMRISYGEDLENKTQVVPNTGDDSEESEYGVTSLNNS